MAFVLKGEVEIDGRKAAITLRGVQQEATKTANTFKQSDAHAQKLGKTLVGLGLHAGKAGSALGLLAKLGTGGIFGYAAIGAMEKFGETVKKSSTDYYSAQKDLADAFETSFKSTSVDQARAGVEKTQDTIESLRNKIAELGPMAGIMKGIEKLFNIDIGVGSTEKAIKNAQDLLDAEMQLLATRQQEEKITKQGKEEADNTERTVKQNKILRQLDAVRSKTQSDSVIDAKAELQLAEYQLALINQQIEQLYELKNVGVNIKLIDELSRKGKEKDLEVAQKRLSYEQSLQKQSTENAKQAQQAGGGLLGASVGGQRALDVARKQRTRQLKGEDFKTQEKVFGTMRDEENKKRAAQGLPPVTAQDMRVKVAQQQAAGEMPSLANKLQAGAGGGSAEQLARESTGGAKGGKDTTDTLIKAVQALVDTMKSGTVVK
jgi:hypothetical protein